MTRQELRDWQEYERRFDAWWKLNQLGVRTKRPAPPRPRRNARNQRPATLRRDFGVIVGIR